MDVLLLNPPVANPVQPPASLAALRGALVSAGYSVICRDVNAIGWSDLHRNREGALAKVFRTRDRLLRDRAEAIPRTMLEMTRCLTLDDVVVAATSMRDSATYVSQERYERSRNSLEALNCIIQAMNYPLLLDFQNLEFGCVSALPDRVNPFLQTWVRILDEIPDGDEPKLTGISINYRGQLAAGLALARRSPASAARSTC